MAFILEYSTPQTTLFPRLPVGACAYIPSTEDILFKISNVLLLLFTSDTPDDMPQLMHIEEYSASIERDFLDEPLQLISTDKYNLKVKI